MNTSVSFKNLVHYIPKCYLRLKPLSGDRLFYVLRVFLHISGYETFSFPSVIPRSCLCVSGVRGLLDEPVSLKLFQTVNSY